MAKKIPSSFNILPQAIYVFAITVLLTISGYFLFWLGKNSTTIEDDIEDGVEKVYSTVYAVGDDIVDYVEEGGEYGVNELDEDDQYLEYEMDKLEKDMGINVSMHPSAAAAPAAAPATAAATKAPVAPTISDDCPNLLIKKGNQLVLYNKNKPEKVGENPIYFKNLDEYIYYIKVQRVQEGKNCPVLYLQEETTAQGEDVYRVRPGPFHTQGGVTIEQQSQPSMMNHISQYFQQKPMETPLLGKQPQQTAPIPFTKSQPNRPPLVPYLDANHQMNPKGFYGIDPTNQYVGKYTVLDQIHDSTKTQNKNGLSDNPMDPNWGGAVFTHKQLLSGKYKGDVINPDANSLHTPSIGHSTPMVAPSTPSVVPSTPSVVPSTPSVVPSTPSVVPSTHKTLGSEVGNSDNPMDTNWGGVEKTREHVKEGVYNEDIVKIAVNTD